MDITQLETFIENDQLAEITALLSQKPQLAVQVTSHQISPILLACFYKKQEIANAIAEFVPELNIFDACAVGKFDTVTLLVFKDPQIVNSLLQTCVIKTLGKEKTAASLRSKYVPPPESDSKDQNHFLEFYQLL